MQVSGASKLKEPGVYAGYLSDNANRVSLSTQQIELVRGAGSARRGRPRAGC